MTVPSSLRNAQVKRFSPTGLSDSIDETDEFPGACSILANLIPDPSTKNVWTPRPAATALTNFASFTTPGAISVLKVIGNYVFGMIASGRNAGKDEPFCFNLTTNTFVTVANITNANTPTSPSTTGDWVPPTMDVVGINLIVTHPGFSGTNYFGWFDITNPAAPRWHAGNLNASGTILTLVTLSGGSGQTPGTYLNQALTGGTGTLATADIVVSGGGVVTSVSLDNGGSGYTVGDTLSSSGLGGTPWSIKVGTTQTTGAIAFSTVPAWVRQFNQRAYFGINPATGIPSVVFTDVLSLGATNANQALTFGDDNPLIAASPLPLSNQLGGIIQSLIVFKSLNGIVQITGDAASTASPLAINSLIGGSGTLAARSIVSLPTGIAYMDHDGFRTIDFSARISDPTGAYGQGVTVPFLSPVHPSRVNAACNGSVLRVSVQNSVAIGQPWQEYWFDIVRKCWSGPHTFPSTCIDVYGPSFVLAAQGVTASLWLSQTIPTSTSTYVENGNQLSWTLQTVMLMDNNYMAESEIAEMQVKTSAALGVNAMNVTALDQNGATLGYVSYNYAVPSGSLWDSATWDSSIWDSMSAQALAARQINFSAPVVYNRLAINLGGASALGFQIGDIFIRARVLGYMQAVY